MKIPKEDREKIRQAAIEYWVSSFTTDKTNIHNLGIHNLGTYEMSYVNKIMFENTALNILFASKTYNFNYNSMIEIEEILYNTKKMFDTSLMRDLYDI